ncbi:hypothetical protein BC332_07425 [Capsicum chinense]|nr:hypothetical protein BC332_07425 [Capsicum chinense]
MTGETRTLGYMVPEVLNGNPYNRKCNMYSFGICLWEIYCCDKPYPDLSFSEVTSVVVLQILLQRLVTVAIAENRRLNKSKNNRRNRSSYGDSTVAIA